MDSCSPLSKTSSFSVQKPPPCLPFEREVPQDESCELVNQPSNEETQSVPLQRHAVQAPPPPPSWKVSQKVVRSDGKCLYWSQAKGRSLWVFENVSGMWDQLFFEKNGADVIVCTDDGGVFPAHSFVLIASSPIFSSLIQKHIGRKRTVHKLRIGGVPLAAASMFIRLLYSSRFNVADMEKFALHLLVLSHALGVPFVKKLCVQEFEHHLLTVDNVIDVIQLARLCDAPRLSLMCLRHIIKDFKEVAKTEGWRIMRESNPALEQELVEAVIDADIKKQENARRLEEEKVYAQLRDAMEALVHICKDGCRTIGPHDKALEGRRLGPCRFSACKGLESLVRHFAVCKIKVPGGCVHCKRMWQLLELHSRMCQEVQICRVPLCRHFKDKLGHQSKKDEMKWKLLVMKVMTTKRKTNGFSLAMVSARLEE